MVLLGRFLGAALHIDKYVIPASLVIVLLSLIPIAIESRRHRRRAAREKAAAATP